MSWLKKIMPSRIQTNRNKRSVPEGLWSKCTGCDAVLYRAELERNLQVCPKCDHHGKITARARLKALFDEEGRVEIAAELQAQDPLKFKDSKKYRDRLIQAQKKSGENEALIVMHGTLQTRPLVACAFEFDFMAGSMASVVGEKFWRATQKCIELQCPLVCFSSSGGARMQEGLFSLMQMAKTSAGLALMSEQGLPYISVMTNPTTGGVSASLAMLGDINIAEPFALIGFAGPRVIKQTVGETLPEGFQLSEFLLEHGALDMIVDRRQLRDEIAQILSKLGHHLHVAAEALH